MGRWRPRWPLDAGRVTALLAVVRQVEVRRLVEGGLPPLGMVVAGRAG